MEQKTSNVADKDKNKDKNKDKDKDRKNRKVVAYVGNDSKYLDTLGQYYNRVYSQIIQIEFHHLPINNAGEIHACYLDLLSKRPHIIYLDVSFSFAEVLYLARLIQRETTFLALRTAVVGLLDYMSPPRLKEEAVFCGIKVCHLKTGETHDVVYDAMYLHSMKVAIDPNFAVAKLDDKIECGEICRIVSISEKRMQVEGDFLLQAGTEVSLDCFLHSDRVVTSNKFMVEKIRNDHLISDYSCFADLKFHYIDPLKISTAAPAAAATPVKGPPLDANLAKLQADREEKVQQVLKKLRTWVTNEYDAGYTEKMRILVIDKKLSLFRENTQILDLLPFAFHCKTYLINYKDELQRYAPDIIVFNCEPEPVAEGETELDLPPLECNREAALKELIGSVKSLANFFPTIMIFNTGGTTAELQAKHGYKQMMAFAYPLSFKILNDMLIILDKKRQQKAAGVAGAGAKTAASSRGGSGLTGSGSGVLRPKSLVPGAVSAPAAGAKKGKEELLVKIKTSDFRRGGAKIIRRMTLLYASETDMILESEQPLTMGSVHKVMLSSMEMFLTIVPEKSKRDVLAGKNRYRGLIHSIGEEDKKALRRFVNAVFFRALEQRKAEDAQKFKELNEKKLQEKAAPAPAPEGEEKKEPAKNVPKKA